MLLALSHIISRRICSISIYSVFRRKATSMKTPNKDWLIMFSIYSQILVSTWNLFGKNQNQNRIFCSSLNFSTRLNRWLFQLCIFYSQRKKEITRTSWDNSIWVSNTCLFLRFWSINEIHSEILLSRVRASVTAGGWRGIKMGETTSGLHYFGSLAPCLQKTLNLSTLYSFRLVVK